jgi:hypothetical protein
MSLSPLCLGWCRGLAAMALLSAASSVPHLAHAQGSPVRGERADPLDAQARVPVATHVSSLAGYRRLGDERPVDWKQANETVSRIGGWRAYAREAQQPDPAASAPAGRPATTTAPSHGGHHGKH